MAAVVTQQQAMETAMQFVAENSTTCLTLRKPSNRLLLAHRSLSKTGDVDFYVFNKLGNTGFVIVSGDDFAAPVLGYCDQGSFDPNNIPDGLQYLLENYSSQMECLRKTPGLSRPPRPLKPVAVADSVAPLLGTTWFQTEPYNKMLPVYAPEKSKACPTGCIATALAQIMRYYQWPEHGKGIGTATYMKNSKDSCILTADLSTSVYQWGLMDNAYEVVYSDDPVMQKHEDAVALLMRDVGYACGMTYTKKISSTHENNIVNAMVNHFDYALGARLVRREDYDETTWTTMVKDEIAARRPVFYGGVDVGGGHAFVVDGYDNEGFFHVNWGWGGLGDGYYMLSYLYHTSVNMNFSHQEMMIRDLLPRPHLALEDWSLGGDVMPANNVRATVRVRNDGSYFRGRLKMGVTGIGLKSCGIESDLIILKPGETREITLAGCILAKNGTKCMARMLNPNGVIALWGNAKTFVVGNRSKMSRGKNAPVGIDDVNLLIDCVLNGAAGGEQNAACDVNGDGVIDNEDITEYVKALLEQR